MLSCRRPAWSTITLRIVSDIRNYNNISISRNLFLRASATRIACLNHFGMKRKEPPTLILTFPQRGKERSPPPPWGGIEVGAVRMTRHIRLDRRGMSEYAPLRAGGSLRSSGEPTGLPLAGGFARQMDLLRCS